LIHLRLTDGIRKLLYLPYIKTGEVIAGRSSIPEAFRAENSTHSDIPIIGIIGDMRAPFTESLFDRGQLWIGAAEPN